MTKIKICGLTRMTDIEAVNELKPEYIGFVFAERSKRFVFDEAALRFKERLNADIKAVGVFVDEPIASVIKRIDYKMIDMVQLHGNENEDYIKQLRLLTDKPIIKAFSVRNEQDVFNANHSSADFVLLDSGSGGTGTAFNWNFVDLINRPYFLAGGLTPDNAGKALNRLKPLALDVSSGVETDGYKDKKKMAAFISAVRKDEIR